MVPTAPAANGLDLIDPPHLREEGCQRITAGDAVARCLEERVPVLVVNLPARIRKLFENDQGHLPQPASPKPTVERLESHLRSEAQNLLHLLQKSLVPDGLLLDPISENS